MLGISKPLIRASPASAPHVVAAKLGHNLLHAPVERDAAARLIFLREKALSGAAQESGMGAAHLLQALRVAVGRQQ